MYFLNKSGENLKKQKNVKVSPDPTLVSLFEKKNENAWS